MMGGGVKERAGGRERRSDLAAAEASNVKIRRCDGDVGWWQVVLGQRWLGEGEGVAMHLQQRW